MCTITTRTVCLALLLTHISRRKLSTIGVIGHIDTRSPCLIVSPPHYVRLHCASYVSCFLCVPWPAHHIYQDGSRVSLSCCSQNRSSESACTYERRFTGGCALERTKFTSHTLQLVLVSYLTSSPLIYVFQSPSASSDVTDASRDGGNLPHDRRQSVLRPIAIALRLVGEIIDLCAEVTTCNMVTKNRIFSPSPSPT